MALFRSTLARVFREGFINSDTPRSLSSQRFFISRSRSPARSLRIPHRVFKPRQIRPYISLYNRSRSNKDLPSNKNRDRTINHPGFDVRRSDLVAPTERVFICRLSNIFATRIFPVNTNFHIIFISHYCTVFLLVFSSLISPMSLAECTNARIYTLHPSANRYC